MSCILNLLYVTDHGLCDTWVYVTLKIELKSYNRPARLSR
jgi:hypothetical protein